MKSLDFTNVCFENVDTFVFITSVCYSYLGRFWSFVFVG